MQLKWTNRDIAPLHTDKFIYSQYVPYFFTLMVPFSSLSIAPSYFAWTTFAALFCLLGLAVLMRQERVLSRPEQVCFFVGLASSLPYLLNVFFGGLSPFILGLIALYLWGMSRKKDVLAGVCLALTSLKPQYAIFMALPAVAQARVKLLLVSIVAEVFLLLASAANLGWSNVIGYPSLLLQADTSSQYLGVFPERMVSIRGPLTLLFPTLAAKICTAILVISLIALFILWRRTNQKNDAQVNWAMSVTILTMLICSPHMHIYDCLYLALLAVLNTRTLSITRALTLKPVEFRCWSCMLILYPPLSWALYLGLGSLGNWSSYWALIYHCLLLLLALAGWRAADKQSGLSTQTEEVPG